MKTHDTITSLEADVCERLYKDIFNRRTYGGSKFTPTITILVAEVSAIIWFVSELLSNIKGNGYILRRAHEVMIGTTGISCVLAIASIAFFIMGFAYYEFWTLDPEKIKNFFDSNRECLGVYSEDVLVDNITQHSIELCHEINIHNYKCISKHSCYMNWCYISVVLTLVGILCNFVLMTYINFT